MTGVPHCMVGPLWGHKLPIYLLSWEDTELLICLAFAGLLIARLSCQVYSSLKGTQEEIKGPTGQNQRRVCSHLCGLLLLLPGLIPAALDRGSLQKGDRAYEVETYKHPTGPSPHPSSHYQDPSIQKIHSLAAKKAFQID